MAKMSKKPRNEVKQRLRVFENNTILLIFSFLAAAAVWFAMMASNSESRATVIRNVPINVEISDTAQEAGVRVFSMSSSATDVSITGNSLITSKVTSEDIGVTATLDPSVSMLTGKQLATDDAFSARSKKRATPSPNTRWKAFSPSEITVVYDKYKETQLTFGNKFSVHYGGKLLCAFYAHAFYGAYHGLRPGKQREQGGACRVWNISSAKSSRSRSRFPAK